MGSLLGSRLETRAGQIVLMKSIIYLQVQQAKYRIAKLVRLMSYNFGI